MSISNELERDVDIDIGGVFATLWSKRGLLLGLGLIAAVLAFAVLQVMSPKYRSETRITIESRDRDFGRDNRRNVEQQRAILDQEGIGSQVQILTSRDVARAVVTKLGLAKRPEFDAAQSLPIMDKILVLMGLINNPVDTDTVERALKAYFKKLTVTHVARTRVISIVFSTVDANLAQEIPEAIASEYLRIQAAAKQSLSKDEVTALEPQIKALRREVRKAEARVASYRASSDILIGRNNTSLAAQQLTEMSTELSRVRSQRANAEAKVKAIRRALNSGASIETISDVLSAPLIQRLRERQVTLRSQIAELSATLLSGHPRIKSLRSQLLNLDQQIRKEARKILSSLQSDSRITRSRENSLKASLNELKAESARVGEDQVELRDLQREAKSQRELLNAYLKRYRQASSKQEQDFLAADARIVSHATLPLEPYFPKTVPIVLAAFFGTILLSSMFILAGALSKGRPVRQPVLLREPGQSGEAEHAEQFVGPGVSNRSEMPNQQQTPPTEFTEGGVAIAAKSISMLGNARIALLSPEGEVGSEGSVLLARYLASGGASVIVVDMTGAGASSRAMIGPHTVPGIKDLLANEASFSDVIHSDQGSRAHIIPTGAASAEAAAIAGDRLFMVFDALEDTYDYVIIDCGAADVAGLSRISKPTTINVINAIDENNPAVRMAADMLVHAGFRSPIVVHPSQHERDLLGTMAA